MTIDPTIFDHIPKAVLSPRVEYSGQRLRIETIQDSDQIRNIFSTIADNDLILTFFDPLRPAISDPGAYMRYAVSVPSKGHPDRVWEMELSNHGWSGGIYMIDETLIIQQIQNIARLGKLQKLELCHRGLWPTKSYKSSTDSRVESERIKAMHNV